MPVARSYDLSELMKAAGYYVRKTGRRITFEYSLVEGENDSLDQAQALVRLVRGLNCHINLIPVNPIRERGYRRTGRQGVRAFKDHLEQKGIQVTVRREMGSDIQAACGQLRKDFMDKNGLGNLAADRL